MGGEVFNIIKVWLSIFVSLSYSYVIGKTIPKGKTRFIFLLPIICLFLLLPLHLSSAHFGGMTSFFISWLANFKLLLFAFGKGPLSSNYSSIHFSRFVLNACFPIKVQQNPPQKSHQNGQNKEIKQQNDPKRYCHKSFQNYAVKGLMLAILIRVYDYHQYFHPKLVMLLYCIHIYFFLELILAILAAMSRASLGLELAPQFNEPHMSSSLQDFWGKRWNLMVTSILRPTVYDPLLKTCSPIIGRRWASLPAMLGTFAVSGFMHEIVFYHLGRLKPTGEITFFFMLHGVCLVIEVASKKAANGRWMLPRLISTPLTIGFVLVTGFWIFIPYIFRTKAHIKAFEEYAVLREIFQNAGSAFDFRSFNLTLHRI